MISVEIRDWLRHSAQSDAKVVGRLSALEVKGLTGPISLLERDQQSPLELV